MKIEPDIRKAKTDEGELNDVIAFYEGDIKRLANSLCRGREDREDLAQTGRLALVSAVRSFDPGRGAKFSTFALMCARRRMLDELRKKDGESPPLPMSEDVAEFGSVDDALIARQVIDDLPGILSEKELKAVRLRMEGRTYDEIAAALGTGRKGADNALRRARDKINELHGAL